MKWTRPPYPVATLPKVSRSVAVTVVIVPATEVAGRPERTTVLAAAGLTRMPVCDPVIEVATVSITLTELVPTVLRVIPEANAWTPASVALNR